MSNLLSTARLGWGRDNIEGFPWCIATYWRCTLIWFGLGCSVPASNPNQFLRIILAEKGIRFFQIVKFSHGDTQILGIFWKNISMYRDTFIENGTHACIRISLYHEKVNDRRATSCLNMLVPTPYQIKYILLPCTKSFLY